MWLQIKETSDAIAAVEAKLIMAYDGYPKGTEDTKDNVALKQLHQTLDELYALKAKRKSEYLAEETRYCAQQSECLTAEWIAKKKQQLIKQRMRESAEREVKLTKCRNLVQVCQDILGKYHAGGEPGQDPQSTAAAHDNPNKTSAYSVTKPNVKLLSPRSTLSQTQGQFYIQDKNKDKDTEKYIDKEKDKDNDNETDNEKEKDKDKDKGNEKMKGKMKGKSKSKGHGKGKSKAKKTETTVTLLELDELKEQFDYFDIDVPKGKEDLLQAVVSLRQKAKEIESKPLTEVLVADFHRSEDSDERMSDRLSLSSLSLSNGDDSTLLDGVDQ